MSTPEFEYHQIKGDPAAYRENWERIFGKCKRYPSVREMDRLTTGHFHPDNKKCPKCGATLLKNLEGDEWCSLVTCNFGIDIS